MKNCKLCKPSFTYMCKILLFLSFSLFGKLREAISTSSTKCFVIYCDKYCIVGVILQLHLHPNIAINMVCHLLEVEREMHKSQKKQKPWLKNTLPDHIISLRPLWVANICTFDTCIEKQQYENKKSTFNYQTYTALGFWGIIKKTSQIF